MIEESKISDETTLYSKEITLAVDLDVLVSKSNKSEASVDFSCFLQFLTRGMLEEILKTMDELEEHIDNKKGEQLI